MSTMSLSNPVRVCSKVGEQALSSKQGILSLLKTPFEQGEQAQDKTSTLGNKHRRLSLLKNTVSKVSKLSHRTPEREYAQKYPVSRDRYCEQAHRVLNFSQITNQ
jgi:hypothetical protein